MPTVEYLLYDVFTDTPFTGNPLAVAVDPPTLTDEQMQTIANELNLSETVFLDTSTLPEALPTRIYTPGGELPFAGHPTIGAAMALADAGLVSDRVTLLEGVGPVDVALDGRRATLTTAAPPHPVEAADPEDAARSIGLELSDLHREFGVRAWSAGVPFTIVTVTDVETLGRATPDVGWWRHTVGLSDAPDLYVLAPAEADQRPDARHWRARMFAPGMGIGEDPATGSAAAAACGYLVGRADSRRLEEGWTIEQGVEMGRRSVIEVGAVLRSGELVAATVGGGAVRVGRGELRL